MRQLTDHKLNGLNDALNITVIDERGAGNANYVYEITLPDWTRDPDGNNAHNIWTINFQNGPIKEAGFNGVSGEALLAILIDQLRGFQSGEYACRDNDMALAHLEAALFWLQKRTRERLNRGVEGTSAK